MSSYWKTLTAFTSRRDNSHHRSEVQHTTTSSTNTSDANQPDRQLMSLHTFTDSEDVHHLEDAVELGKALLPPLARCLEDAEPDDFVKDKLAIVTSLQGAFKKQYTLGIAGNTGHGKSSLINALLGEDELVPTSSCRACTAVAIELSWNDHTTSSQDYVACIVFIDFCELKLLLEKLIGDYLASSPGDREDDGEVRLIMDTIRALIPVFDFDHPQESFASALSGLQGLHFLGTTKIVEASCASDLLEDMSLYLDSEPSNSEDNSYETPAMWPFTKVVRIHTRSDILSTGLVLVDLPGVADANAARSNVAAEYLKKCDGVWVVADITRAADDRQAHKLLGNQFKQQMRLDGNYANITMVCTKADNLNVDRDGRKFNYPNEKALYSDAVSAVKSWKRQHKRTGDSMLARKDAIEEILDQVSNLRDGFGIPAEPAPDGHVPYKKRRATPSRNTGAAKKRIYTDIKDRKQVGRQVAFDDRCYRAAEDIMDQLETGLTSQTEPVSSLQSQRNPMADHLDFIESLAKDEFDSITEDLMEKQQLDSKCQQLRCNLKSLFMSERNAKAVSGARQQFKSGLKEMDEHLAPEDRPVPTGLDSGTRDYYEALSDALPVFCVSSTAYQEFLDPGNGRPEGFEDEEATQIPPLKRHAMTLTEKGRIQHCKRFLNKLTELVHSLRMWENAEISQRALAREQRHNWQNVKQSNLDRLRSRLFEASEKFVRDCEAVFQDRLFENMNASLVTAEDMALDAASRWSQLHHKTYQAVCRRDGEFSNSKGPHDFNEDLISPFKRRISSSWEQTFIRFIPNALETVQKEVAQAQNDFHEEVEKALPSGAAQEAVHRLQAQLQTRKHQLQLTAQALADNLSQYHREANRQFKPPIQETMRPTYAKNAQQSGRGYFDRMQGIMSEDLSQRKAAMFSMVNERTRKQLGILQMSLKRDIASQIEDQLQSIDHDYSFLLGTNHESQEVVVKDAKTRDKMRVLLDEVERRFEAKQEKLIQVKFE